MTCAEMKPALQYPKPSPPWLGEPQLGSWFSEEEIEAVVAAMRSSMEWTGEGFGFMVNEILEFEAAFAGYVGTKHAVSLCTASIGLDLSVMCLDLEPGDEIISPAINFRAAHAAILGQGAKLIFCEVDPVTLQADPADVERRITPRTRAIYPVHFNGLSAPMDDLLAVAERNPHPKHGPLKVVGDAARACGGGYRGTKIGKRGWMTIFSFHTMKNMNTLGEGGMITTDDDGLAGRLRAMRQWGLDTEYWGSSYKLTKPQAAMGLVQLGRLDQMIAARARLGRQRTAWLSDVPELTLPADPPDCDHSFYLYTVLVAEAWAGDKRDLLVAMMQDDYGVGSAIANPPTYDASPYIRKQTLGQCLPASDLLGRRLFCPPMHPSMTDEQNAYVAAALQTTVEKVRAL